MVGLLVWPLFLFIACARPQHSDPVSLPSPVSLQVEASQPEVLHRSADQGPVPAIRSRHTGIYFSPSDVPSVEGLPVWTDSLARLGITVILLEMGTGNRSGESQEIPIQGHVYFPTRWAETARDLFGELAPVAHRSGLSIFAVVSLRRMNWVDPALGWMDRSYDGARMQFRFTPYLDIFHPAFQEYAVGLFTDLARTGIDGVLFRNDVPLGPADGFSSFALQVFERDFQTKADLSKLFPMPVSGLTGTSREAQREPARHGYSPEFWRWTGWKAREMIKVTARLRRAMQSHTHALHVALEIHPEAVTDPVQALVQYGEDLLEAKRRGIDFFLVQRSSRECPFSIPFLEQAGSLIGGMERLWVPVASTGPVGQMAEWLTPAMDREQVDRRVGLIYMRN